jgi:aspartate carbamoyltransferase catalytic subunit
MPFTLPHLTSAFALSRSDIEALFDSAKQYHAMLQSGIKRTDTLQGVSVVLAFFENSTRTRMSFEIAAKRLSAEITGFQAAASSINKGETLLDTIRNIEAMHVDILVMRHSSSGAHEFIRRHAQCRVVNAGDGQHEHPTQALLDAFTLAKKFGSLHGMRYCLVGDILHSRVARSNIPIFKALGAEVGVCAPGTLLPRDIASFGVRTFSHIDSAVAWADAMNVLRIQFERQDQGLIPTIREYTEWFGVKDVHLRSKPDIAILHPGPINRGIELEASVADAAQSLILPQVEHGVAIRMAVLDAIAQDIRTAR